MVELLPIQELVLLNQYVQGIVLREDIVHWYSSLDENSRKAAVKAIWILATQARILESDLTKAIDESGLKPTHTPVQMLKTKKMPFHRRGYALANLKGTVLNQAFLLVLECFALAERRRKDSEDSATCNHWWHKDLSNENVLKERRKQNEQYVDFERER
jgi:hypothetical protein